MLFLQQGKLHARKKRLFLLSAKIKMRGGIKVYSFKSVQLSHKVSIKFEYQITIEEFQSYLIKD